MAATMMNLVVGENVTEIEVLEICLSVPQLDEAALWQIDIEILYRLCLNTGKKTSQQRMICLFCRVKIFAFSNFYSQRVIRNKVGNKVGNKRSLNLRRQKIISEIRDNPNITTAELYRILGVSQTAVDNNIKF